MFVCRVCRGQASRADILVKVMRAGVGLYTAGFEKRSRAIESTVPCMWCVLCFGQTDSRVGLSHASACYTYRL